MRNHFILYPPPKKAFLREARDGYDRLLLLRLPRPALGREAASPPGGSRAKEGGGEARKVRTAGEILALF